MWFRHSGGGVNLCARASGSRPRDRSIKLRSSFRSRNTRACCIELERRTLLATIATVDIVNGVLTYDDIAGSGATNHLTIKASPITQPAGGSASSNEYTFADSGGAIALGAGAKSFGWSVNPDGSVSGPDSDPSIYPPSVVPKKINSIVLNLLDSNDWVNVQAINQPTTVSFTNNTGAADTVIVGLSSKGAQNIEGDVTILNQEGTTAVVANDTGDGSPKSPTISGDQILNLAPHVINYSAANATSVSIVAAATLNVNAGDLGPVVVTPGGTTGSGTIAIGSTSPINYANIGAVNIVNAADQPITMISRTVTTTTGDTPVEGKAFTFQVASFVDSDTFAKPSNFTAEIAWGAGPAGVSPGTIETTAPGQFVVTGSHTYRSAGTFTVTVTVVDTGSSGTIVVSGIPVTISDLGGSAAATGTFTVGNLVSDGSVASAHVDSNLIDAWGLTTASGTSIGVTDTGKGLATFYGGTGAALSPGAIVVPPASGKTGSPTGIVYNDSTGFVVDGAPATYLFDTLDGLIAAWNANAGGTAATMVNESSEKAEFTGLAIAVNGSQTDLYAANFASNAVEIFSPTFKSIGMFTDSTLPPGYAPYNIANINGDLYVTFAERGSNGSAVAGDGLGYVDVFTPAGVLLNRLIANGPLDAPYGIAIAPAGFGSFGGDLLIGNGGNGANTDDGLIHAFDLATGALVGTIETATNAPVFLDGLKAIGFGSGGNAGSADSLDFASGPNDGADGLFGTLTFVTGESPSSTVGVNKVTIADAAIKASASNVKAIEGVTFSGEVASFTDDNPFATVADFTKGKGSIVIEWGDGTFNAVGDGTGDLTVVQSDGPGSPFIIYGKHIYKEDTSNPLGLTAGNPYSTAVTIKDRDGSKVLVYGTATVADASLIVRAEAIPAAGGATIVEGATVPAGLFVGQIVDQNPFATVADFQNSQYQGVTISLSGASPNKVTGDVVQVAPGLFDIYTPVPVVFTHAGLFATTISVTDIGGKKASAVGAIDVVEEVVQLNIPSLLTDPNAIPTEGKNFSGLIDSFTSTNPFAKSGDFTVLIDWGDGSPATPGSVKEDATGTFWISGSHTYQQDVLADGSEPTITVTVDDSDDVGAAFTPAVAQGTATIFDAPISGKAVKPIAFGQPPLAAGVAPAAPYTIASFTDSNPFSNPSDFNVAILWSDGIAEAYKGGLDLVPTNINGLGNSTEYDITATHAGVAMPAAGSVTYLVTVTDANGGSVAKILGSATLATHPITALPAPVVATEGESFTETLATIHDSNPNATINDFMQNGGNITVNWGDGSSNSVNDGTNTVTIQAVPSSSTSNPTGVAFLVIGTHTYNDDDQGAEIENYQVNVTINDSSGNIFAVASQASVSDPILTDPGLPVQAVAGRPFQGSVATFTSSNPLSTANEYSATILWGDGSASRGTIEPDGGGSFSVIGDHVYKKPGAYSITTTIQDNEGHSVQDDSTATVTGRGSKGSIAALGTGYQGRLIRPIDRNRSFPAPIRRSNDPLFYLMNRRIRFGIGGSGSVEAWGSKDRRRVDPVPIVHESHEHAIEAWFVAESRRNRIYR